MACINNRWYEPTPVEYGMQAKKNIKTALDSCVKVWPKISASVAPSNSCTNGSFLSTAPV
jgi:hypothetical protein